MLVVISRRASFPSGLPKWFVEANGCCRMEDNVTILDQCPFIRDAQAKTGIENVSLHSDDFLIEVRMQRSSCVEQLQREDRLEGCRTNEKTYWTGEELFESISNNMASFRSNKKIDMFDV